MKKVSFLFAIFCLLNISIVAQRLDIEGKPWLTHELTPEEKLRLDEIGLGFVETPPPAAPVRNVAEFDRMQGVLVRYPFGIPITLVKEMAEDVTVTTIVENSSQRSTVLQQYVSAGVDTSHCDFLFASTNSYWTRDYGPWFESDSSNQIGIVDFPYNRPRPADDEIPKLVAAKLGIPWFGMRLIHTGGNYMTDGMGISASTELVWEENPTLTQNQVAQKVNDYLGIQTYQVRTDPNGTYIDHIDCWSKFLAPDKILVRKVPPSHPQYTQIEAAAAYWTTQICSYGYPYNVFRVMTPNDQPYTNSVILNNKVLLPVMNSSWDDSAKSVYQDALPGYEVIKILGNPITPWESTDALHCRVMGIADIGLLYINHIPLSGNLPCETDYVINADLIVCSHQQVKSDSVLIWYKVNNGNYQPVHMTHTSANHYTGSIPKQPAGSTVYYYLFAADESGRNATCPLIGPGDPFSFSTVFTDITAIPDTLWFLTGDDAMQGKITQLHNYTASGIALNSVQQSGTTWPWFVDSISVASLPYLMNEGDSIAVRVKLSLPVSLAPSMEYYIDSMEVVTTQGSQFVIIMINQDLMSHVGEMNCATLGNSFPNPFTQQTTIPFIMKQAGRVELSIMDTRGTVIRTLTSGTYEPGVHAVIWDGTGATGNKLPAGIYLYKFASENLILVKRMAIIR